ncbi:MAG TPA: hypothetical protein VK666_03525 [Chryseolinea sp.]|nr:hypothetical protein [Chryseolinea sp.]
MKKIIIVIALGVLSANFALAQFDKTLYLEDCLLIKKVKIEKRDALDVKGQKFLDKDQVLVYFHLKKSDTLNILINDSSIQKRYVSVASDRTGDNPDFSIKLTIKGKPSFLTVYFENDKSFFKMKIDKKYRVLGVVYHTGAWENCIYIEKSKYFRFF